MKRVTLPEIEVELPKYLNMATEEDIVITREGKPVGILIGFDSEDDWFDYQLENDPRFLNRVAQARESVRNGRVTRLEDIESNSAPSN